MENVRNTLDRLIRDRGEDYAALSRLIGRNPAYIQQFIHRGSPRKLAEDDRKLLARYLGVDESLLGGPATVPVAGDLLAVPRLAVEASAGPGALANREETISRFGFDARWLRSVASSPHNVSAISVRGESMLPTLSEGDEILVDGGDAADRLRDGIYVLRVEEALLVKRIALNPAGAGGRRLSIRSDNPAYPDWEECDPASVEIIGRVIWVGRRMA
jgi:phage repressor protein C with HTH and peptisase S24 domain